MASVIENPDIPETDLQNIVSKSFEKLLKIRHEEAAKKCGIVYLAGTGDKDSRYIVNLLNKTYTVELGSKTILDLMTGRPAGGKLSYVILSYIMSDGGGSGPETWHPVAKLLKTQSLVSYYQKYVTRPIIRIFGYDKQLFERCATQLGGVKERLGGNSFSFKFLPKVKLVFQLWVGSREEFSQPEVSISYNTHALKYLSTVSLIYACEVMANFLERESRGRQVRGRE